MGRDRLRLVVALGGNALLRRGEPPEAASQQREVRRAARRLAPLSRTADLVVTHGNGPQVGLLALMGGAYAGVAPYPLDVLGAETEGQIGYLVELELHNAIADRDTVAILTRTEVDAGDPAFERPTKFVGPAYDDEAAARTLAAERGWTVRRDGAAWRRVVPSPEPQRILQLEAIGRLVDGGFVVVCAGGGGIPVVPLPGGGHAGIEAVVDKDLASSLLARELRADALVLATDVDAVYTGFGTPDARALGATTPAELRAIGFPAGSMAPKVESACRFVERTGGRAAIGSLEDVAALVAGEAGTQVRAG